jgi:hypothetical protein
MRNLNELMRLGFTKLYGDGFSVEDEVDKIMANVDNDHNGYIDYTGKNLFFFYFGFFNFGFFRICYCYYE